MAEFTVEIDQAQFDRLNVRVRFDEGPYGELIDESLTGPVPHDKQLNAHFYPWPPLLESNFGARVHKTLRSKAGRYLGNGVLHTYLLPDQDVNADTLLHETKHWLDDVSGEFTKEKREAYMARLRRKGYTILGATTVLEAGAPIATYAGTQSSLLAYSAMIATSLATIPLLARIKRQAYYEAPHEVAARAFANDPERLQKFGSIITYDQIDNSQPMWKLA